MKCSFRVKENVTAFKLCETKDGEGKLTLFLNVLSFHDKISFVSVSKKIITFSPCLYLSTLSEYHCLLGIDNFFKML